MASDQRRNKSKDGKTWSDHTDRSGRSAESKKFEFRNSNRRSSAVMMDHVIGSMSPYRFSGSDNGMEDRVENIVVDPDDDDEWDSNDTENSSAAQQIVHRLRMMAAKRRKGTQRT